MSEARANSSPPTEARPALLEALAGVARWREHADAEAEHSLAELASDEARIQAAIHDLNRRLVTLGRRREELREATLRLDQEEIARSHQAVLAALSADEALLAERGAKLLEAQARARARAEAHLTNPEIQSALREYEGFAEVEASLGALPPSYRRAILAHNDQIRRQLEPVLQELSGASARLDLPPATVTVVAAVEPGEGPPEALVLVAPVPASLYTEWDGRPMDLGAGLAYRLVAVVAELAARLGVPDAPLSYRPFEGHLAVQLWLARRPLRGNVRDLATSLLERARGQAAELAAARLDLLVVWLPAAVLMAEEDDEEDQDTEGDSLVMRERPPGAGDRDTDAGAEFLIADPGSEA